ncbi:hypothetical protein V499_00235 [Pseudogymnoascus sp. VKM F-103]|nr:hypothetical protein V499_00235 [Pseudogymnoascus sp. VKM F-103]
MTEEEFKEREKQISHLRERVGLSEDPHIRPEQESTNRFSWPSFRVVFREPFAEFFGTMVMVMFGNGSVAQVLLGGGEINAPRKNGYGSYQGINWGWGIGIFLGIYIAGDSGCYLNPAITMGFCLFRKLPWRRCPIYFLAQCLGGFVGAGVVYANNVNGIDKFEGHGIRNVPPSPTTIAAIFCTYPQPFLAKTSQFVSEFVASSILMFAIFALKDVSNPGAMGKSGPGPLFPLGLFFLIFGLGAAFGYVNTHQGAAASGLYSLAGIPDTPLTLLVTLDPVLCHIFLGMVRGSGLRVAIISGFLWWPPSVDVRLGVSCTTPLSTPAPKAG